MNTMEDKVRLALRETGDEISPHSVPPLRLRRTRHGARLPGIPGRWGTWLTPLAAAAAVAAVVAASLAISTTFHGHARSTGQAAAARWNGSPVGPRSALRKVPPYFVVLPPQAQIYARTAQVRSTVTGRLLATFSPPRPYKVFTWVSGTADEHTFVLAAQRWWNISSSQAGRRAQERDNNAPTVFFKLTFTPHIRSAQLTRLSIPEKITATNLGGVGVSPDGTRLALDFRQSIQIVTLATGAIRTWTWPGSGWIGNWKPEGQIFSWSADGRYLEFQQWGGRHDTMHVRILDTTAPGTSLTAARVVLAYPYRSGADTYATGNSFLTPDGTRIVTATSFFPRQSTTAGGYVQIAEYSARTGKPVLHEDRFSASVGSQDVLWSSPDGSALVISDPRGAKDQYGGRNNILGVLAGNKFTPIPHGADNSFEIAW
jgi:hypothetical protein